MSNVLYYYAKLNSNDVCYGFETLAKKFKEEDMPSNLVHLVDYNETYLWKKYDRDLKAFGQESYEPDTDFELLERISELEGENLELKLALADLAETYETKLTELQLALAELAEMGV